VVAQDANDASVGNDARGTPTYAETAYVAVDIGRTLANIKADASHALNTNVAKMLTTAQRMIIGGTGGAKRKVAKKRPRVDA
jgi:hypothetical protein